MIFSDGIAGTCVEEEGKGRGFLPSLQVTGEGRIRRHEQRKRDEGGERGKERQKRGEEKTEKEGERWKLSWGKKKRNIWERGGQKEGKERRKNKATRSVG